MAITRQLNLEALMVNAPAPPLMYPLPGGFIMDQHRRKRRDEAESKAFTLRASMRLSSMRIMALGKDTTATWGWRTRPLWVDKWHRLVGSAAHSLVSDYIFHQPTIVLVWIFIALIFVHFFFWLGPTFGAPAVKIPHNAEMAAAAIVGWLFLVRAERGP